MTVWSGRAPPALSGCAGPPESVSTLSGPNAELWFGKRVKATPGTELGPDRRGEYGKVSETGRYFTYDWWFGHHMARDGSGRWDEDEANRRRRASFGRPYKDRKDTAADRKRREAHEYAAYCNERYQAAEKATKGYMVTPAGRARGYDGQDFFDPDARKRPGRRWMTDELRAWFGDGDSAAGDHGSRGGILSATAYRQQTQEKHAA